MLITTLTILFYSFLTIFILSFLGIGLTAFLIPDKLKSCFFWLTPWYSMFFLIFFLVIFSLFGFTVSQISPFLIVFLVSLNITAFTKKRIKFNFNVREDIIIFILMFISIIFNSGPLIRRVKLLTTVSFGNNDVIIYASSPDYFVNHSIADNYALDDEPLKPNINGINGMIKDNFRWGSPIIPSFFLNIFRIKGYQYTYLFELIIFGLTMSLIYILFKILYKNSIYGLVLSTIIFAFNSNLLYILYHDFLGQIFFWGIETFLLIHLFSYFSSGYLKENLINKFDFIIGLTFSVLFFSYHEAAILIIAPIFLFLLVSFIKKDSQKIYIQAIIKIFFIAGITSFISIIHAIKIDFLQAGELSGPIGWQLFRSKIPYANPFEAMGFYSIHNFEPMSLIFAITLSIGVLAIIFYGFYKSKQKTLTLSFLFIYSIFFVWTIKIHHNFWAYNRALTYSLPLFLTLFSIGVISIFKKRIFLIFILILLISLEFYSSIKLNNRFLKEFIVVDKALISLRELNNYKNITEPICSEQIITGPNNLWRQIWSDYFLYPNKSVYTPYNIDLKLKEKIISNCLFLISKPSKLLLKNTVWENEYFKLGKLCDEDKCLIERKENLSIINFGSSEYEDSLLINGWNIGEEKTRWANEKISILRLISKETHPASLLIEAFSLGKPQEMSIYIDDQILGKISIGTEWKSYKVPIGYLLDPGVHKIKFVYSHGYRPMYIIPGNLDSRILYVNFRKIAFE